MVLRLQVGKAGKAAEGDAELGQPAVEAAFIHLLGSPIR